MLKQLLNFNLDIMHKVKELLGEANRAHGKADYLTYKTYPLVSEVKLLGAITENIHEAFVKARDAVLLYDRLYKRINTPKGDFEQELKIFQAHCARRYNIDRSFVLMMNDINVLLKAKKAAPMEFTRNNKYVFCSNEYKIQTLTIKKVKEYLASNKLFLEKVNGILRF